MAWLGGGGGAVADTLLVTVKINSPVVFFSGELGA